MEIEDFIPEHLAKGTQQAYITTLNRFVNEFLSNSMNIEQLLAEAKEDVTKTQDRIDGFYQWLLKEKGMRESSAFVVAYGNLRGFFSNNDIAFQRKWSRSHAKKDVESESIRNDDKNYSFFSADEETQTVQFNSDAMREFLANLTLRDQAITLALLSSGQDSGDLFQLTVGDIKKKTKNGRIYWAGKRQKTDILFKTFLSREATKLINQYVAQDRADAKDSDPLFVFTSHKNGHDKIPMNSNYLGSVYRDAAKRMKVQWKEDESNPLRPKRMRHLFRTACDTAGLQEIYTNAFMGHKNHMGMKYSEIPPATLEVQYMKVEPFLTVFSASAGESQKTKEEIANLKTTVGVLSTQLEQQKKVLEELHEFMTTKVEEITTKLIEKRLEKIIKAQYETLSEPQSRS